MGCAVKDYRGNSSILIGPHASGKSQLIKQVMNEIISEHSSNVRIETITLYGQIFPECQSVLRFMMDKVQQLIKPRTSGRVEYSAPAEGEELSEFVSLNVLVGTLTFYRLLLIN